MPIAKAVTPNEHLRHARLQRGWSQDELADRVGVLNARTILRWEQGTSIPSLKHQQLLCAIFEMTPEALGFLAPSTPVQPFDPEAPIFDFAIPIRFANPHDLVGRDGLLAQLKQFLCSANSAVIAALHGMPGIGKTALTTHLAHDAEIRASFKGGILWAELGPEPDILRVLSRWGRLLGLSDTDMSALRGNDAWSAAIRAGIGGRRLLLVIDDAWHVEHLVALELGGPSCAYLITTRMAEVAGHFGEGRTFLVPDLSEDESVTLLERLAPVVTEAGTAERATIHRLVTAVGGSPLALTLMGSYLNSQTRSHQPRRIRAALEHLQKAEARLQLQRPQAGIQRHPSLPETASISLESVIGISDQLLNDSSRQALRALSVFPPKPNTFSEEAALAVAGVQPEILDVLVDAALLEVSGLGRYTLHQTIADYASIRLQGRVARQRLVTYMVGFVEEHAQDFESLEKESSNILTALEQAHEFGQHAELVRGVLALASFLLRRGYHILAVQQLERAYNAAVVLGDTQSQVPLLLYLGDIEERLGHFEQAEAYLHTGLCLARERGDWKRMCAMLRNLGKVSVQFRGYEQADAYYQEGLALARQIGDLEEISAFLINMGTLAKALGDFTRAQDYQQEALALARQIGKDEWIIVLLLNQGNLVSDREGQVQAEPYWQEGLALARKLGYRQWTVVFLVNLGGAAIVKGDYEQAEAYLQEGLHLSRQLGHIEQESAMLGNLGELAKRRKDYAQAKRYLQEGLALAQQIGKGELMCEILALQGDLALDQQRYERAEETFHEMLRLVPKGNRTLIALAQYGLARASFALGRVDQALSYAEMSATTFEEVGHGDATLVGEWLRALPMRETEENQGDDRPQATE